MTVVQYLSAVTYIVSYFIVSIFIYLIILETLRLEHKHPVILNITFIHYMYLNILFQF